MDNIKKISKIIKNLKCENEIFQFLNEILTPSELKTLSKRWRILDMLNYKKTQREIAKELNVSLCKVTRGAKILKNNDSIIKKCLKGKNYE